MGKALQSFVLVAALLALLSCVVAEDSVESKEKENRVKRKFDVEVKKDEVQIKAETKDKDAGVKDKIGVKVETKENDMRFRIRYWKKAEDTKEGFKYAARFHKLVEFVDADGDGYTDGEEVNTYDIGPNYKDLEYIAAPDENSFHTVIAQTADDVFKATMSFAEQQLSTDEGVIVPNGNFKIDIAINYATRWTRTDTKLALVAKIDAKTKQTVESEDGEGSQTTKKVSVEGGGQFSWADYVTCNGTVNVPVIASPIKDDDDSSDDGGKEEGEVTKRMIFTFDQAYPWATIEWDPEIGVGGSGAASNVASMLFASFGLLFALLFQ
jgi:hypothetical protein